MTSHLQAPPTPLTDRYDSTSEIPSRISSKQSERPWYSINLLITLMVTAVILRLWAIGWGYHCCLYGDEGYYMPNALKMLADRRLNTGSFHNSHLLTNLYVIVVAACGSFGLLIGVFDSFTDFGRFVWDEMHLWTLVARMIVAIFGTGTVLLTYRAATLVTSKSGALVSAFIIALSPLHIYYSKIGVNDVVMVFFITLTIYLSLKWKHNIKFDNFLWLGVFCGLSAGAKYNGGMVLLVPAIIAIQSCTKHGIKYLWLISAFISLAGGLGIGFLISNPAAFIYVNDFITGFETQLSFGKSPWPTQSDSSVFLLMFTSFITGLGYLPLILGLLGAIDGLRIDHEKFLPLVIFAACYIGYMLTLRLFFPRFMLPVYPVFAILAGSAVVTSARVLTKRQRKIENSCVRAAAWTAVIALLIGIELGWRSFLVNQVLWRGDTREIVANQMRDFLDGEIKILADFDASAGLGIYKGRIELLAGQPPQLLEQWSLEQVKSDDFDYVMISSQWQSYCSWDQATSERYTSFAKEIANKFPLVLRISPYIPAFASLDSGAEPTTLLEDLFIRLYSGPTIYVYKVPKKHP